VPNAEINKTLETDPGQLGSVSPYKAGLTCSCPNCGKSPLYNGLLEVKDRCTGCGFDLAAVDAGDGAQIFVIMILGTITTLLGVFLYNLGLSKWVLLLALISFVIVGSVWMLRILKATLVALQFYHDAGLGTVSEDNVEAANNDSDV